MRTLWSEAKDYIVVEIESTFDYTVLDIDLGMLSPNRGELTWYSAEQSEGGIRLMVGPGSTVGPLVEGKWRLYIRPHGPDPRIPIEDAGSITVRKGPTP